MKKIVFIVLCTWLSIGYVFSQESVSLFVPLKTVHIKKNLVNLAPNEGGSYGLIATIKDGKTMYTAGFMENSYGDLSPIILVGFFKEYLGIETSFHIGMAFNYHKAYRNVKDKTDFEDAGMMPAFLISQKYPITDSMGVQMNFSPSYFNGGIYINL